jgi:GNAT superfamily N-acetyltransferase
VVAAVIVEGMRASDFERVREIARLGQQQVDIGVQAAQGARAWVAREGRSTALGFMLERSVTSGRLHVLTLATHPECRRRGVGKALLRHALARAPSVELEVRRSNEAAINLYRAHGFSVVGVSRGYYGNEDAIKMVARRVEWLGVVVELYQPTKTLDDVVPEVRPKFEALIAQAKALGLSPKIRSAGRTCSAQQEQFDLGYSKADFCRSMHVLGHAVDLDLVPPTCDSYTKLGEWWESQGGVWGGRWKQFGPCGDQGHFHYGFNGAGAVPTSVCPSGVTYAECVKIRQDYLTKAFGQSTLGPGGSRMGIFSGLLIVGAAAAILYATMNVKGKRP